MSPTHTHTHTRTDRPTIRDASHLKNIPVCHPEEKARKSWIWRNIASCHGHLVDGGGQGPHDEVPQLLRGGVGGRSGLAVHQALVHAGGPAGVILIEQHTRLRVSKL